MWVILVSTIIKKGKYINYTKFWIVKFRTFKVRTKKLEFKIILDFAKFPLFFNQYLAMLSTLTEFVCIEFLRKSVAIDISSTSLVENKVEITVSLSNNGLKNFGQF